MVLVLALIALVAIVYLVAVLSVIVFARLVVGHMGILLGGIGSILFAVLIAARQAYACGWTTVAMIVPVPRAAGWQDRISECDSPGAAAAVLLFGPALLVAIVLALLLTLWLHRKDAIR